MAAFSLGSVWEETIAFLRRESALLLPVAFATFGAAQLLLDLGMPAQPSIDAAKISGSPATLLALPAMFIMLIGNLGVTRIVLDPGRSVGESLLASFRRIPPALLAVAIVFAVMAAVALIVIVAATLGAMAFRVDPRAVTPNIVMLLFVPMFIAAIRLIFFVPVLAVENLSAMASLRRAWALSRDHFLRLVGLCVVILFATTLLGLVQLFVLGSLFKLLAFAIGNSELALILEAILRAGISSVLSLAITVYVALLYRHAAVAQP